MARPARRIVCDGSAKARLLGIARSRKRQPGLSLRAEIILQCLEDRPVKVIARDCGVCAATAIRGKNGFIAGGIAALSDHYGSGRPRRCRSKLAEHEFSRIPALRKERLTGDEIALLPGLCRGSIFRVLRKPGCPLWRKKRRCNAANGKSRANAASGH